MFLSVKKAGRLSWPFLRSEDQGRFSLRCRIFTWSTVYSTKLQRCLDLPQGLSRGCRLKSENRGKQIHLNHSEGLMEAPFPAQLRDRPQRHLKIRHRRLQMSGREQSKYDANIPMCTNDTNSYEFVLISIISTIRILVLL